jgi:hypothetical protein
MVRPSEAGFDLRGTAPLSQDPARWDSDCIQWFYQRVTEAGRRPEPAQRMSGVTGNTPWPIGNRDMRDRLRGNRHLHDPVESIIMNVGVLVRDAKESGSTDVATRPKSSDALTRESA